MFDLIMFIALTAFFVWAGRQVLKAIYGTAKGPEIAHEREVRKRARQVEMGIYNGQLNEEAARRAVRRVYGE